MTAIGERAFFCCDNLISINIPEGVTEIGNSSFHGCCNLTSITIPENVTKIGNSAFHGCSKITSINIPESVTEIGEFAFYNCDNLTAVHINSIQAWCNIDFGNYSTPSLYRAPKLLLGRGQETEPYLLNTNELEIFTHGDYSEQNSSHIAYANTWGHVDFGKYSANPLFHAHNLYLKGELVTELIIPEGVDKIGERTFLGCDSLKAIAISKSVAQIGNSAFDGCHSLRNVTLEDADTVLTLGYNNGYQGLFHDCPLETLYIGRNLYYDNSSPNGCSPFFNRTNLTTLTISDKVSSIRDDAFNSCSSLTSITIPESVTEIGSSAFQDCSSLTSTNIPKNVNKIDVKTFFGCKSLTSIEIPESVTEIGSSAFQDCSSLTSIDIPESVTKIGYCAFRNCSILETISFPERVAKIGDDAFFGTTWYKNQPNGVIYINNVLYEYKGTMPKKGTSITVKEGTVSISPSAFLNCDSLIAINYPESMSLIGESAFYDCDSLKAITIPKGVAEIGDDAFFHCDSLKTITCNADIPPMINENAFDSNIHKSSKLFIPKGTKEAYQSATGWKNFYNIDDTLPSTMQHTLIELPTKIYDLNGRELKEPQKGINIINGRKIFIR